MQTAQEGNYSTFGAYQQYKLS